MMCETRSDSILTAFPPVDEESIDATLKKELDQSDLKIVVLDDDPTGVQTVHDISVYTDWSEESVSKGFHEKNKTFFILTNSRGLTAKQTEAIHEEIAQRVHQVSQKEKRDYIIISRSDSTLRGHYPLETKVLSDVYRQMTGHMPDGEILVPFFKEGGRYTIDNIHFVRYGNTLVPAAETEFAKDKTFGYASSYLPDYIEEKTQGAFPAHTVTCISLDMLRRLDYDGIVDKLMNVRDFNKVVVNAVDSCDIKVFCVALYRAMAKGKRFMFRSAAALVKVMGGITDQPLLTKEQMIHQKQTTGGLIVIGSHTQKTTSQLENLRLISSIHFVHFHSDTVLNADAFKCEISKVTEEINQWITDGTTVAVYTDRSLLAVPNDTKEDALLRSVQISDAVQSFVANLTVTPSFIVAKGGITSSDIGTKALKVKRANVLGQIQPGIPVWETGEESLFPQIPYVIFPGNVGDDTTLKTAVEILM